MQSFSPECANHAIYLVFLFFETSQPDCSDPELIRLKTIAKSPGGKTRNGSPAIAAAAGANRTMFNAE
jgi:hypothetical protein